MTVTVPHRTTVEAAMGLVDRSTNDLFDGVAGKSVELVDRKTNWNGRRMDFSLTAQAGFISVPISGAVVVDEVNVTVHCELPELVKKFVGEDKMRGGIEQKMRGLLGVHPVQ
jgi:hypothetical protein